MEVMRSIRQAGRVKTRQRCEPRQYVSRPPINERLAQDLPAIIERAKLAAAEGDLSAIQFLGGETDSDALPFGLLEGERKCLDLIERLAEQRLPFSLIARELNLAGFRTRHNSPWIPQSVRLLVTKRFPHLMEGRKRGRPRKKKISR